MNKRDTGFFVGYLPMPHALFRFYLPLAVGLAIFAAVGGYFLASLQKSAGAAVWNTAATVEMRGILTTSPYPILHRRGENGGVESVLLVGQGKHAAAVDADFDGRAVRVRGFEIARDGWRMLEIVRADAESVTPLGEDFSDVGAQLSSTSFGETSVTGEIADSKCFLGVMKPGIGGVHKACAELCLRGGIPPMLLAQNTRGEKLGYILMRADGDSAAEMLAPYAAESVRVQGELLRRGDLMFIKIYADSVTRR